MNTIVQEDKIKFPFSLTLCSVNNQFMVFVLQSQPKTLKIRHLYDQSYSDLTTLYPHSIVSIHLSNSNHLVVVDDMSQVDIVYLQSTNELKLTSIKGFQKKQLVDVVVDNNLVAMLTQGKLHILQLKQNTCLSSSKHELVGTPIKGSFIQENLYICCNDNTIRKWIKGSSGKFLQSPQTINLKQQIIEIKTMRNLQKDYLICLSKNKQVAVISSQGKVVDILNYEGDFKTILVNHQLLTIVSTIKQSELFSMYYCEKDYHPHSSRLFFNKFEAYNRNALYSAWQFLPISKKQWAAYSRRKGAKELHPVTCLNQETFCLIYGRLQNDPAKLQLLKIDTAKILNKDRSLEPISRYKPELPQAGESPRHEKPQTPKVTSSKESSNKEVPKQIHKQPAVKKIELSDSFLKAVQKIVDERITPLISRIHYIQQKLNQIQSKISSISSEAELSKLYSATLEKQVISLFETKIVPKMQEYFQQIFANLAHVFNQGIEYYNQKLVIETNLQKETFKGLIAHTLTATNDILEATKSDLPYTLKIDELLNECVKKKDELLKKTEELLERVQKGPFSYKSGLEKETKEEEKKQKEEEKKGKKNFVKSNLT